MDITNAIIIKDGETQKIPRFVLNENDICVVEFYYQRDDDAFNNNRERALIVILGNENADFEFAICYGYGQSKYALDDMDRVFLQCEARNNQIDAEYFAERSAQTPEEKRSVKVLAFCLVLFAIIGVVAVIKLIFHF